MKLFNFAAIYVLKRWQEVTEELYTAASLINVWQNFDMLMGIFDMFPCWY